MNEMVMKKSNIQLLRDIPITVPLGEDEDERIGVDANGRPCEYITNDFEAHKLIIIDHTTGLMWQQSGSDSFMFYENALTYIEELNTEQFAGYHDWRLPTVPELMSLLTFQIPIVSKCILYVKLEWPRIADWLGLSGHVCISPVFDREQLCCFSADTRGDDSFHEPYGVDFYYGRLDSDSHSYVRAVRCWKNAALCLDG